LQERNWGSEQISHRIAAQFPVEKKIANASFVVWSEGSLDILAAQLDRVLALCRSRNMSQQTHRGSTANPERQCC
jgi:dephospho-CoA kinase